MSDKLNKALSAETTNWNDIVKIFSRLRGINHIHMYMSKIVPDCSLEVLDTLMHSTFRKGYHSSHHLARLIALIWTRILTVEDSRRPRFSEWTYSKEGHEIRSQWKKVFHVAYMNWEDVGSQIRVPDIEQVVEALSKTARIVRALPRPMNATLPQKPAKIVRRSNFKVQITEDPAMPLVHFFVFQNLPPILTFIAAMVYPEQVWERDSWGNLPLHYANLSATEWTNWWNQPDLNLDSIHSFWWAIPRINFSAWCEENTEKSPNTIISTKCSLDSKATSLTARKRKLRAVDYVLPTSTVMECSPAENHNVSSASLVKVLLHETAVPFLTRIYSQGVHCKCRAGRTPLQTYLLSLLDYRRSKQHTRNEDAEDTGTAWHFVQEDIEQFIELYPESVAIGDPLLEWLPVQLPALALWCRSETLKHRIQTNQPLLYLTQDSLQSTRHLHADVSQPHSGDESDDEDGQASETQPEVIPDCVLDTVVVSLTYKLLRSCPQVLRNANHGATDSAMLSMYESQLYARWKARIKQIKELELQNKQLESKMASLIETQHVLQTEKGLS